ncbi:MAG: isoprenylcysteine carboxylmethyltransferase family protein, partial [Verrucomicrobiae bacterium]|nr:isoprenylcysteine carboxylmethyltransferase family protein [Verrucomicrobiae bacterium]
MPSSRLGQWLVAAQVGLCVWLIWLGWSGVLAHPWLWPGVVVGVVISASGVWAMRLSRLRVTPEPGEEATLCERGIYGWIRHPMYAGLLLAFAMFAIGAGNPFAWLGWAGLLGVLLAKLRIEERLWSGRDPAYRAYMSRTKRLVPGV